MKKLFPLIVIISTLLLAGCSNVSQEEYDNLQKENTALQNKINNYENYIKCQEYLTDMENDNERVNMIIDLAEAYGADMTAARQATQEAYEQTYTILSTEIEMYKSVNDTLADSGSDITLDMSTIEETYNSYENDVAEIDASWTKILAAINEQNNN